MPTEQTELREKLANLDIDTWFDRVWWEAYHEGQRDSARFRASTRLLDIAKPEFKAMQDRIRAEVLDEVGQRSPKPKVSKGANIAQNSYEVGWNDCRSNFKSILASLREERKS